VVSSFSSKIISLLYDISPTNPFSSRYAYKCFTLSSLAHLYCAKRVTEPPVLRAIAAAIPPAVEDPPPPCKARIHYPLICRLCFCLWSMNSDVVVQQEYELWRSTTQWPLDFGLSLLSKARERPTLKSKECDDRFIVNHLMIRYTKEILKDLVK
jgi:hypothetical protein